MDTSRTMITLNADNDTIPMKPKSSLVANMDLIITSPLHKRRKGSKGQSDGGNRKPSTPRSHEKRGSRRVTFDLQRTKLYETPNKYDQPLTTTWYKKDEYMEMKASNERTAKFGQSGHVNPEKFGFCYRGLEHKTMYDHRQRRNELMHKGFEAVFLTQYNLRMTGMNSKNSTLISQVYGMEAFPAQLEAHKRGIADAEEARLSWIAPRKSDRAPQIPRRTWARAG